ncbi:bifunctional folylpolyglutamate synthase/dihydrofolate synthase [Alphaproteobacteria bacterium]|nr:bifunctional folylpolyglutamate synthase/dihydrofolate synthase [Alphaproteobacteria bacterium]
MIKENKLSQTLDRMFSFHPKLIDFDLSRLKLLMEKFNNPQNTLRNVVHIAGTNGKGSTATFLKGILENHKLSVNLYTSPHLINFNERIRINTKLISEEKLIKILEEVETKNENKPITFFEITTAAAIIAFNKYPSDVNIIETGLGGRLDATNIIENKKLTIITKIGFDHIEFLGKKIEDIAREKAGIFRKNTPVIIATQKNKKARKTLLACATKLKTEIIDIENISLNTTLGLSGDHQYENASTAYTAAKIILPLLSLSKTKLALKQTTWPGRVHQIEHGKIINYRKNITILDGAHNEDSAYVLDKYLNKKSLGKWNLIIGMLRNRDVKDFVNIFKNHINKVFAITIPDIESSYSPDQIIVKLKKSGLEVLPAKDLENALQLADKEVPLLITGSLYLAGYTLRFNNTKIN